MTFSLLLGMSMILFASPPAVNAAEKFSNTETLMPDLDTGPDAMILIENAAILDTGPQMRLCGGNYIDYICADADPAVIITSASENADSHTPVKPVLRE